MSSGSRLPLDERLERMGREPAFEALNPSDRGLVRAIASSALRGLGLIRKTAGRRGCNRGFRSTPAFSSRS
jgi:hypothetical protein